MRVAAPLLGLLLVAGCLGSGPDPEGPAAAEVPATEVPPGCDPGRPAVVHTAGAQPITWDGYTSVGIPCLVATGWTTAEPSLGVTGSGTLFLYPAFQAPTEALATVAQFTGVGVARSLDEGRTFTRQLSEVAGLANWQSHTADPFMYVEPYTDRVFIEDLAIPPFNCANLSFSDDEGETWTQTLGGCLVWDHVGYGSGPPTVSNPSYPVVLQRCAITYVATTLASMASGCQKSLDGGMTWEPPGDPAFLFGPDGMPYAPSTCHGAVHHPFVDHRGWTWLGRDWCGSGPWVALSKDEGATWTRVHVHQDPIVWHDVAVGADASGLAYAFWISSDDRPLLAVSKDDGATWSAPWDIGPPGLLRAGNNNIAPAGRGNAGFSYAGEFEGQDGVFAILAAGYELDSARPVFVTAVPREAINGGSCGGGLCSGQADFLDANVGPDGTVWGSFDATTVAAGRLWGAPSLWDEDDPDGVFGGWQDGATDP